MNYIHVSMFDVANEEVTEFDRWYRDEFLPKTIDQHGWLAAHRYECREGSPNFLTLLELENVDPEEEDRISAAPFRAEEAIGRTTIRNYFGETFESIQSDGVEAIGSELINAITTEVAVNHAREFDDWYRLVHVPEILSCPGWLSSQRYRSVDFVARFLALYALDESKNPFHTAEYENAVGWDDHVEYLYGFHGFRTYEHRYSVTATS